MVAEIAVVGAGIGGLTLGAALRGSGIDVKYYEQAEEFGMVGSGITMMNNGMEVLDRLGLGERFREVGDFQNDWVAMDMDGAEIFRITPGTYGIGGTHRSKLHELLIEEIEDIDIEFDKRCVDVDAGSEVTTLSFADGTEVRTEHPVIGADGTHSAVRAALFPDVSLQSTGHIVHRGLPEVGPPDRFSSSMWQVWGDSYQCGMTPYGRGTGEGYWYFVQGGRLIASGAENLPAAARPDDLLALDGEQYDPNVVMEDVLEKLADAPSWVTDIVESTPTDTLVSVEPLEVPRMDAWTRNNVTLLGDSAHPMTPFLSVGGAMAMEDALVLAHCLTEYDSIDNAYAEYEALRIDRAYEYMDKSRQLGLDETNPTIDSVETYRTRPNSELQAEYTIELPEHEAYV